MNKKAKKIILITLLVITLLVVVIVTPFLIKFARLKSEAEAMVAASSDATFKSGKTTQIYDCNGNKIANMLGTKVLYYVDLKDIPQLLQDAFIVMEDRKFYDHRGVDLAAIIRAVMANYSANSIEQGASTITQQLARNVFLTQEVTWERKIQEMYVALALERTYSKDKILEYYLNNIYFANGYYGVEAAALGYFGKSVGQLNLSALVFIATIPNNPSKYVPTVNYSNVIARRNIILG
ncbi:MAG: transglycosylase domain-containing protein, partial [Lachnospiraceae bacterium]